MTSPFVTASQLIKSEETYKLNNNEKEANSPKRRRIHMDMHDCMEHAASPHGAQPLSHPSIKHTSSKDPNKGLYPCPSNRHPLLHMGFTSASSLMDTDFNTFMEQVRPEAQNQRPKNRTQEEYSPPKHKSKQEKKKKGNVQTNNLKRYFSSEITHDTNETEVEPDEGSSPAMHVKIYSTVKPLSHPSIRHTSSKDHPHPSNRQHPLLNTGFTTASSLMGTDLNTFMEQVRPKAENQQPKNMKNRTQEQYSPSKHKAKQEKKKKSNVQTNNLKRYFTSEISHDTNETEVEHDKGSSPVKHVKMYSPMKKLHGEGTIYIIDSSPESTSKSIKDVPMTANVSKRLFEAASISKKGKSGSKHKLPKKTPKFNCDSTFLYSSDLPSSTNEQKDRYGLLGNGMKEEESTEFCYFNILPVEVIENILCMLPILDLNLNVNRVCQHWNKIITNPKFLPWKKLYHRVKMNVDGAKAYVAQTMKENMMTDATTYLPGLIRFMKNFRPSSKYDAYHIECLKKHPKYSWAEALLQERFPDCMQNQEVNPWSLVACLVFVSHCVMDVQLIIQCLLMSSSQCMASDVLECLYCICVLLFTFKMLKIKDVWYRLHYIVFYALYLFENSSFSMSSHLNQAVSGSGGQQSLHKYTKQDSGIRLTHEQLRICNHDMKHGDVVKIIAFAGTGKTTTLVRYTQLRPSRRFLLVVYNKSVCEHAKTKFPVNVECKTGHALAYAAVGRRYAAKGKLSGALRINEILDHFKARKGESLYVQAKFIIDTLNCFMASDDEFITSAHVPSMKLDNKTGNKVPIDHDLKMHYADCANKIWKKMIDMNHSLHITHDTYLKLYQLSRPHLKSFDVILIDEAQDLTPAIAAILLSQSQAKLLVGDPNQQIYSFRGAVNAMQQVDASHTFYLTQSFRFGPEISFVANTCLELLKGEQKKTLVGNGNPCDIDGKVIGQLAIITRSNFTLFNEAVKKCCFSTDKDRVAFVGGTDGFGFPMILDMYTLMTSDTKRTVNHPLIRRFGSFVELEQFAEKTMDNELLGKIRIVKTHHNSIPSHINKILLRCIRDVDTADFVLSTAHKAKGLEFSTVRVTDDYTIPFSNLGVIQGSSGGDESNLLYVAVTRAKKALQMSPTLHTLLKNVGENSTYPVWTRQLQEDKVPMKCMVTDQVFQPTAITLVKKPLKIYDTEERPVGVISPQCVREKYFSMRYLLASVKDEREGTENDPTLHGDAEDEQDHLDWLI